jgi:5-oxoprolinase (ATP-hydrolysing)
MRIAFAIDRGGTFTDCIAHYQDVSGWRVITEKLLSQDPRHYEDASREGIRRLLERVTGQTIPRPVQIPTECIESVRLGTTIATNALLERKGERCALVITKGFKDLLIIGRVDGCGVSGGREPVSARYL